MTHTLFKVASAAVALAFFAPTASSEIKIYYGRNWWDIQRAMDWDQTLREYEQAVQDAKRFEAELAEVRRSYFAELARGEHPPASGARYYQLLGSKDFLVAQAWLATGRLGGHGTNMISDAILAPLLDFDGGIPQEAYPAFYDWGMAFGKAIVEEIKSQGALQIILNPAGYASRAGQVADKADKEYQVYVRVRDRIEFEASGVLQTMNVQWYLRWLLYQDGEAMDALDDVAETLFEHFGEKEIMAMTADLQRAGKGSLREVLLRNPRAYASLLAAQAVKTANDRPMKNAWKAGFEHLRHLEAIYGPALVSEVIEEIRKQHPADPPEEYTPAGMTGKIATRLGLPLELARQQPDSYLRQIGMAALGTSDPATADKYLANLRAKHATDWVQATRYLKETVTLAFPNESRQPFLEFKDDALQADYQKALKKMYDGNDIEYWQQSPAGRHWLLLDDEMAGRLFLAFLTGAALRTDTDPALAGFSPVSDYAAWSTFRPGSSVTIKHEWLATDARGNYESGDTTFIKLTLVSVDASEAIVERQLVRSGKYRDFLRNHMARTLRPDARDTFSFSRNPEASPDATTPLPDRLPGRPNIPSSWRNIDYYFDHARDLKDHTAYLNWLETDMLHPGPAKYIVTKGSLDSGGHQRAVENLRYHRSGGFKHLDGLLYVEVDHQLMLDPDLTVLGGTPGRNAFAIGGANSGKENPIPIYRDAYFHRFRGVVKETGTFLWIYNDLSAVNSSGNDYYKGLRNQKELRFQTEVISANLTRNDGSTITWGVSSEPITDYQAKLAPKGKLPTSETFVTQRIGKSSLNIRILPDDAPMLQGKQSLPDGTGVLQRVSDPDALESIVPKGVEVLLFDREGRLKQISDFPARNTARLDIVVDGVAFMLVTNRNWTKQNGVTFGAMLDLKPLGEFYRMQFAPADDNPEGSLEPSPLRYEGQPQVTRLYLPKIAGNAQGSEMTVTFKVDASGRIQDVSMHGRATTQELSYSLWSAASLWKFRPARSGGQPVESKVIGRLAFRDDNSLELMIGKGVTVQKKAPSPNINFLQNATYPAHLLESGVSGWATVNVTADQNGKVSDVTVVEATHPDFGESSMAAALASNLSAPGHTDNSRPTQLRLEYRFEADGYFKKGQVRRLSDD